MKIAIINGSVRRGRATTRVAKWVEKMAAKMQPDIEFEAIDLHELQLPMFDEPQLPMMNPDRKPEGALRQWLDALDSADGYVFVTPEYNHGMPASLKNAIDYISFQIMHKPFTVVSHGVVGGARSAEQLKLVLNANIGGVPIPSNVTLAGMIGHHDLISEEGDITTEALHHHEKELKDTLETLVWFAEALKEKRDN